MSQSAIRKKGYLFKLPVKGLLKKWSRRWFVLHATSHEGVIRMEYFDSEGCELGASLGKRTIPLRDCSGIKQSVGDKTRPYVFELQSQIGYHQFACDSQPELEEWVENIKEALHEDKMKRRQRKTQSLVINRDGGTDSYADKKGPSHTNYSDITEGTYRVRIEQNETANKMALEGEYNLQITTDSLSIVGINSGATIAVWHYKFLKNYGKQHGRFHFETGKASPTGEGNFLCVTTCSKEIFGVVHRNIKKLREAKEGKKTAVLEKQVEGAVVSQQKIRDERKAASLKKQSSSDKGLHGKSSEKRSSREIAGQPTTGRYRTSRDFEETADTQNLVTSAEATDDIDPSHLYTAVNKEKKQEADAPPPTTEEDFDPSHLYATVNKQKQPSGPPPKPQPYSISAHAMPPTPDQTDDPSAGSIPPPVDSGDTNRHSLGSVRDSRDSAFVQFNLLGSFDEELENLQPLTEGAVNPMASDSFGVPNKTEDLINFDIGQLGSNFLGQLDDVETGTSLPTTASDNAQLTQHEFDQMWDNIFSTVPTAEDHPLL